MTNDEQDHPEAQAPLQIRVRWGRVAIAAIIALILMSSIGLENGAQNLSTITAIGAIALIVGLPLLWLTALLLRLLIRSAIDGTRRGIRIIKQARAERHARDLQP